MDRRSFLALAACATAALPVRAFASGFIFPPGIQLYTVREPLAHDAPATLKALHDIGFREVETAGFGKYTAAEFGRLCHDAGLAVPSAHLPFQDSTDLSKLFADARALGAQYATSSVLRSFGAPAGKSPEPNQRRQPLPPLGLDGFKQIAGRMNVYGRQAKSAGLTYAYHNHNFEFEKMPDGSFGYDVLLKETDPALVKFEIDCGWMMVAGAKPTEYFKRYPGRFRMLHIKDFQPHSATTQLVGPETPSGVELGHGFIDYRPIFASAKQEGVEHVFAEQEAPYQRSPLESAKVSYDYLQSVE